jgi:short-subunit dehydrogenase
MSGGRKPGLAVVTGASSGIGFELARCCAGDGYDLVIAADEPAIVEAARVLASTGVSVTPLEVDLATEAGVEALHAACRGRPVDLLLANAGRGLGHAFLDQDWREVRRVIDTNITGTMALVQRIGRDMRSAGQGRILLTGSIAGFMPGSYQAVYNGTKAFIDSFSWALRDELKGTGVTVTCLMPGPTDTRFFERAHMLDTKVGADDGKASAAGVARDGYAAMLKGESGVVSGWSNKIQAALAHVMPSGLLAQRHRKMAAPGTGTKSSAR